VDIKPDRFSSRIWLSLKKSVVATIAISLAAVSETSCVPAIAYLAGSGKNLLLSEDLFYRQLAGVIFPDLNHTWLQSVFAYGAKTGIITRSEYASALTSLASLRHEYVSVDAATLVAAFVEDATESLERFSILANYIGVQNADWLSHLNVTAEFLCQIVDPHFTDGRMIRAVNMMTEKLLRHSRDSWPVIFAALLAHPRGFVA